MQNYDKLALLFEVLAGSNQKLVSHKINEIKLTKEYEQLSSIVKQENDVDLKDAIETKNVHTYLKALKLEENVSKLSAANNKANENKLNVSKETLVSKQSKRIRLYMWYNKAHSLILDSLNVSKAKVKQLKNVKFSFASLDIVYYLYLVFSLYMSYDILLSNYRDYRLDPSNNWYNIGLLIMLLGLCFVSVIKIYTRNYAYLKASKVEKDITYQISVITNLDEIIKIQDKNLDSSGEVSDDFKHFVDKINEINASVDDNDLVDYCSTPKQYFVAKNKGLMIAYFVVAGVGMICGALVLCALIIGL